MVIAIFLGSLLLVLVTRYAIGEVLRHWRWRQAVRKPIDIREFRRDKGAA